MHSGIISALRVYMLRAKPWQQLAVRSIVVAAGIALLALGNVAGIALVLLGLLIGFPLLLIRTRSAPGNADRKGPAGSDPSGPPD